MLKFEGNPEGHAGTVLLLHAFPVSASMWEPQIAALRAAGYGAVAPHVHGFDGSPADPGWSMETYARELAALLDSLGVEKVTVAGLSMGGYQAFAFWKRYPERVASLVLCDTRANSDAPEALAQRQAFREAVETNGSAEAANRMVPNFFTRATCEANPELVETARAMILRQDPLAISEAMRAIAERPDSTGLLDSITCPVLFVNGDGDTVTPTAIAAGMQARAARSRLEVIPDAGHLTNLEQPGRFNRILLEHLASLKEK
jgi:non-heme chloroperoxidase